MKTKLIRDGARAPDGGNVIQVDDSRVHIALLIGKLHEKAQKIAEDIAAPDPYADIMAALMRLMELGGVPLGEVERKMADEVTKRGGFNKCRLLHVPRQTAEFRAGRVRETETV